MIRKVINQLNEENYEILYKELSANRGEKFSKMLELYRKNDKDHNAVREALGINVAAFYAMKSRLTDKVQEYLFRVLNDKRGNLLKNISSIPHLINSTPKATAIVLLEHLAEEIIKADLPRELIGVYNGLKKLHLHSDQYYHYQQLYNKSVAFTLATDKADEFLCTFNREVGEYLLSGDKTKIEILGQYLKELRHLNKVYDSHSLKASLYLANISYALFVSESNEIPETEETTEELLKLVLTILESHPENPKYFYWTRAWHVLNFEYYNKLKLYKNGLCSFEKVNSNISEFMLLSHTCPTPQFLLSKIEYAISTKQTDVLLKDSFLPEITFNHNPLEYVYESLYKASCLFYSNKFLDASVVLNTCLNEMSFKNYPFAEFQVKLFQTLLLLLSGKNESAEIVFRSVSRKLQTEEFSTQFPQAIGFSKLLKIAISDNTASKAKKIDDAFANMKVLHAGSHPILNFVVLSVDNLHLLKK